MPIITGSMWHGILIINKERGLTSHQVVANLRRILHQTEIGHTGTLDPEATGVLVMGLGQATRSFPFLNENIKIYRAEIILGAATDTQDATGTIIHENPHTLISLPDLKSGMNELTGEIFQVPPMFSAVKVNGRKLYDLARKGIEVERISRAIRVFSWRILNLRENYGFRDAVSVEISCSKGTYIRTLIHDLGEKLHSGAHMGKLVRVRSGDFDLADSITIQQAQTDFQNGTLSQKLIPLCNALHHLPSLHIDSDDLEKVQHGGKLSFNKYQMETTPGMPVKVLDQYSQVVAIAKLEDAGVYYYWQPVKVFNYMQ